MLQTYLWSALAGRGGGMPGQLAYTEEVGMPLIRRRTVIDRHDLSSVAGVVRYALLRDDGLPEIREIRGGVDRIVSQKFTKIPLPPADRWWEGVERST